MTEIRVFQDRQWAGDPRLGSFTVYVDGKTAGVVRPLSVVTVPVAPGSHTVRVRQWWYFSPRVVVEIDQGSQLRFRAEVSKDGGFLRSLFRTVFVPWRAANLVPAGRPEP